MPVLMIFVDGIGIGMNDSAVNPCTDSRLQLFNSFIDSPRRTSLPYNGQVKAIDAALGIAGIPQSATGQTTLLTGINAPAALGRHLSGFPNQQLRDILAEHSIHRQLTIIGKRAAFINAYHPRFFELDPKTILRKLSVTSIANWKAGLQFMSFDDLRAERAVFHDFTNRDLIAREYDVPEWSAEKAGEVLAKRAMDFDYCLYEYFKTDHTGHAQMRETAVELLENLELFILTVLHNTQFDDFTVIVTSDHGNIEDVSIKSHTMHPVPLMVWGKHADVLINEVQSIADIAPILLRLKCE